MDQITPGDVVTQYLKLRGFKEALETKHAAELKPITDAMATLDNWALAYLNSTGGQNFAAPAGTVFKKTITSLKVTNRDQFLDFVAAENAWDMLTAAVAKDAVKAYMENTVKNPSGGPPPGVEPTFIHKVEFRKA